MDDIKNKTIELYTMIKNTIVQTSSSQKEKYVALTKTSLEESVMWAVKGITI